MDRPYDETLAHVRTCSRPSELKITDIRFAHITAASMHCILVKIYTDQGLVGMGEIRDSSSATYAAMLKSRCSARTPATWIACSRKIRSSSAARAARAASSLEIGWDLAGKAFGIQLSDAGQVPRLRADVLRSGQNAARHAWPAPANQRPSKSAWIVFGFKMCKTVLSVEDVAQRHLMRIFLIAPPDFLDSILHKAGKRRGNRSVTGLAKVLDKPAERKMNDYLYTEHPYTMLRVTDRGLDRYGNISRRCARCWAGARRWPSTTSAIWSGRRQAPDEAVGEVQPALVRGRAALVYGG